MGDPKICEICGNLRNIEKSCKKIDINNIYILPKNQKKTNRIFPVENFDQIKLASNNKLSSFFLKKKWYANVSKNSFFYHKFHANCFMHILEILEGIFFDWNHNLWDNIFTITLFANINFFYRPNLNFFWKNVRKLQKIAKIAKIVINCEKLRKLR